MHGVNTQQQQTRFFPVDPKAVFNALGRAVEKGKRFKLKEFDDFTLSMTYSSKASGFTWGENFSAQVVPHEGGGLLGVSGVGKVGGQYKQATKTNKLIEEIFNAVTNDLRSSVDSRSDNVGAYDEANLKKLNPMGVAVIWAFVFVGAVLAFASFDLAT